MNSNSILAINKKDRPSWFCMLRKEQLICLYTIKNIEDFFGKDNGNIEVYFMDKPSLRNQHKSLYDPECGYWPLYSVAT